MQALNRRTLPITALVLMVVLLAFTWLNYQNIIQQQEKAQAERTQKMLYSGPSPDGIAFYSAKRGASKDSIQAQRNLSEAIATKREFFSRNPAENNWEAVGPFDVGGRTRALVFSPDNDQILYTAGVSGGVFKSVNGGAFWTPVSDDLENMAIVTLAILPDQPDVIFAGSGEGQYVGRPITRSRGVEGNGIFTSSDAGTTWRALPFTLNNPDFRFVNKLRVGSANTLLAATETGIWRSSDLGESWDLVLDQDFRIGGCLEIEVKPGETDTLVASCGAFEDSAMFQTTDGGDSWQEVLTADDMGRTVIAFAPSQPSTVYAMAAQNQFGDIPYALQGIYRSDDSGLSWTLVTDMTSSNPLNRLLLSNAPVALRCPINELDPSRIFGQGWFDNVLRVDPADHQRLWAGGVDLFRSDDGGRNFGMVSFWQANPAFGGPLVNSYVHADQHHVYFHPNYDGVTETRLYAVNDGGVFVTSNPNASVASNPCEATTTNMVWGDLNSNYSVNQFYHGSVSSNGSRVIGGMQDNGTYLSTNGEAWQKVGGGDGAYTAIDPNNHDLVYVSSQFANMTRINLTTGESVGISGGIQENRPFITPYLLDINDSNRLFLGASSLWRSDNQGELWQQISTPNYDNVVLNWLSSIAVKPGESDIVLVGSSDGLIYRHDAALTADASYQMNLQRIADGFVSSINFAPFDTDIAYATVSTFGEGHIFQSNDSGMSWQNIDGVGGEAFPDIPAHDVIKSPEDDMTLYVGSDLGVYKSVDGGNSWFPFGAGMPNVPVERLQLVRNDLVSTLFAFTYGRGAFKLLLTEVENLPPQQTLDTFSATVEANDALSIDLAAGFIDRNLDPVAFSSDNLVDGLSITSEGVLTGAIDTAGTYDINIEASDGALSTAFVVAIEVNAPAPPPVTVPPIEPPASDSGGGSAYWLLFLLMSAVLVRRRTKASHLPALVAD